MKNSYWLLNQTNSINYGMFFLIIAFVWILQVVFAIFQNRSIIKEINQLKKSHNGYLGVGIHKPRFNIGSGLILLLVIGFDERILDVRVLSGISNFARFKKETQFFGLTIDQMRDLIKENSKLSKAFEQALERIQSEKEKYERQQEENKE